MCHTVRTWLRAGLLIGDFAQFHCVEEFVKHSELTQVQIIMEYWDRVLQARIDWCGGLFLQMNSYVPS
jgi:hypothetical protein